MSRKQTQLMRGRGMSMEWANIEIRHDDMKEWPHDRRYEVRATLTCPCGKIETIMLALSFPKDYIYELVLDRIVRILDDERIKHYKDFYKEDKIVRWVKEAEQDMMRRYGY